MGDEVREGIDKNLELNKFGIHCNEEGEIIDIWGSAKISIPEIYQNKSNPYVIIGINGIPVLGIYMIENILKFIMKERNGIWPGLDLEDVRRDDNNMGDLTYYKSNGFKELRIQMIYYKSTWPIDDFNRKGAIVAKKLINQARDLASQELEAYLKDEFDKLDNNIRGLESLNNIIDKIEHLLEGKKNKMNKEKHIESENGISNYIKKITEHSYSLPPGSLDEIPPPEWRKILYKINMINSVSAESILNAPKYVADRIDEAFKEVGYLGDKIDKEDQQIDFINHKNKYIPDILTEDKYYSDRWENLDKVIRGIAEDNFDHLEPGDSIQVDMEIEPDSVEIVDILMAIDELEITLDEGDIQELITSNDGDLNKVLDRLNEMGRARHPPPDTSVSDPPVLAEAPAPVSAQAPSPAPAPAPAPVSAPSPVSAPALEPAPEPEPVSTPVVSPRANQGLTKSK